MLRQLKLLIGAAVMAGSVSTAMAQEGKLVLYASQPNTDAQQTSDAFKAKYPDVDFTFVRYGTPRWPSYAWKSKLDNCRPTFC